MAHILHEALIPEIPNYQRGKVRDNYDLEDGVRVVITSDRLSAFDRPIADIPQKGRVLTKLAEYWFKHTRDICQNHLINSPDGNVLLCRSLKMFPVEIVVRDYLAGTTDTSILQMYKKGERSFYGYTLPDGLCDNAWLPQPMITPTTKSSDHDAPLSAFDVVDQGLCTSQQWVELCRISLKLFERGREMVARNGLILVDTKYEFGLNQDGEIVLADEIHTPDSSRFWFADTYMAAALGFHPPQSFDKDNIRRWINQQCDPYKDPIPEIPADVIAKVSEVYIEAYEKITGTFFRSYEREQPILERIREVLHEHEII